MNKEEADLIIAEQNKSKEEILKAVAKVKSDYHELCKLKDMRIAELEKENAELKHQLAHRNCLDCSNHSSKLRMRNLDLEKENAELKKDKKELCHSISEGGKACVYLNEQLTNAKEIIKNLLSAYTTYADSFDDRDNEIVEEAEQFLNSEVER